ncbi:unnamed protein product, partial [Prunus brigantina]
MAAKKDKQKMSQDRFPPLPRILPATLSQNPVKHEPSPSFIKSEPSTIIPYPGHTPLPIMNKFTPLGTTVAPLRPNYQSALVSSYDPFQLPPTATPMSSQFFPKSSPYVLKNTANLFILEPHIHKSMSPAQIAKHHFPTNFHYLPHSPYKSLKFYREILHETKSVEIKPIRDKTDPTKIIYHSLYIHKLKTLTKEKWVKLDKSEVVSSHPPAEAILLTPGTKTIVATPFKIPDPTDEPNKRLIEQNNYTNQSLVVVGRQLDKIETKIDKLLPSTPKLKSVDKPLVQFQDLQPKFALKTSSTTKKIEEMLDQLSPLIGEKSGLKV